MNTESSEKKFSFTGLLKRSAGILQLLTILVFVVVAFIYSRPPTEAQVLEDSFIIDESALDLRPRVKTLVPSAQKVTLSVETTGELVVRSRVNLISQVSGQIVWVSESLRAGGEFKAGEKLLEVDKRDYALALQQANADLASQRANLLLTNAQSQAAKDEWVLLHGDLKVPSLVAKVPQIRQAEARIRVAEASVALAELNLSRTDFSLPFDGRIDSSTASVGQLLTPNQSFGQAYALESLEASIPLSAVELSLIEPALGREVLATSGKHSLRGVIERTSASVDSRSRESRVFVRFDQQGSLIPPGSFLSVVIEGPTYTNTFVLPENSEQANETLWIVEDGVLKQMKADIIARINDGLVVPAFDPADGVVLGLIPGAKVGLSVTISERSL